VSVGEAADGLKFTRSSYTAMEGDLVAEAPLAEAEEYLQPVVAAGKSAPPWLQAIARQAATAQGLVTMRGVLDGQRSCGCKDAQRGPGRHAASSSAVIDGGRPERRIVGSLRAWAADWQGRGGHLRKVMHA
jgi:hypothetical protein